tara:strand:- start:1271 stop:1417 length:147 start_codon:yes stop_codon:yes gene_type:complete
MLTGHILKPHKQREADTRVSAPGLEVGLENAARLLGEDGIVEYKRLGL